MIKPVQMIIAVFVISMFVFPAAADYKNSEEMEYTYHLTSGWNMIFLPVSPDKLTYPAISVNAPETVSGTFDAVIDITNVTNLDSGQFDLSFDASIVDVISVDSGSIDSTEVPIDVWDFSDSDTIRVLFNLPDTTGVSGSGSLATISFEILGVVDNTSVLDVFGGLLVNNNAEVIPSIWNDCEVTIGEWTPVNRVHNINTGEDFPFIQTAIDDPDTLDGHVIEVGDGVYYEYVKVTKSLTIRSLNGSANCVIQDVGYDHVVEITADHVSISGFTVTRRVGRLASDSAGIYLSASHCNVSGNNCSNKGVGIHLDGSGNNSISSNDCSHNGNGIYLGGSGNNSISSNDCSHNGDGICIECSSSNVIYLNNFRNRDDNCNSRSSINIWNSTSKINYTYREKTFADYLGNYWDDYTGSDSDKDGIGDSPYRINSDNDNYPLMMPFENYFTPEATMAQVCVNAPEVVSGTFDIEIDIHNVVDLDCGQFDLFFDSSVVNVTGVDSGSIEGTEVPIDMWRFIDSDTIRVIFNLPVTTVVSGSGSLATIHFAVTGTAGDSSTLDISNGLLVDIKSEQISTLWSDDEVSV